MQKKCVLTDIAQKQNPYMKQFVEGVFKISGRLGIISTTYF